MSSRRPDFGFARTCVKLIFKIIAKEVRSTTDSYDIKLALKYITWIQEMGLCRLDEEMSMYFGCLDITVSRLCTISYYTRLPWEKMRTFFASAVLRLLAKYISRYSVHSFEISEMGHLLNYIKLYDPQLFEPDASGNLNPSYTNVLLAYRDYIARRLEHERRVAYYESQPEDTKIIDRFSEIFSRIFDNNDINESEDGSPF